MFCKYCGCPHKPQSDFNTLQERCRKKMKFDSTINSQQTVEDILANISDNDKSVTQNCTNGILSPTKRIDRRPDFVKLLNECHSLYRQEVDCVKYILSQIQTHTNPADEVDQKLTELALVQLMNCFTKDLVQDSVNVYNEQKQHESSANAADKVLVPTHTFLAIVKNKDLDILTNLKTKSEHENK